MAITAVQVSQPAPARIEQKPKEVAKSESVHEEVKTESQDTDKRKLAEA
jgi:hypothetical protein